MGKCLLPDTYCKLNQLVVLPGSIRLHNFFMQSKYTSTFSALCSGRLPLGVSYWPVTMFPSDCWRRGQEVDTQQACHHVPPQQQNSAGRFFVFFCFKVCGTYLAVLILLAQVIFFDKTEAVLSSKSHTVTYVDKRGQAEFSTIIDHDFGIIFCIDKTGISRHLCKLLAARGSKSRSENTQIE